MRAQEREAAALSQRDFGDFITDLAHGAVNQRLTEKLLEIADAVCETHNAGELILKLKIKEDGGMAVVTAAISTKKPEKAVAGTLFFFGPGGALTREDPRQLRLKQIIDVPATARIVHSDPED